MPRFIEYYEIGATNGKNEYFSMPVDNEAKNKENLDRDALRIWKYNTFTDRFYEIKNRTNITAPLTKREMFKIQMLAKPVPYSEQYLRLEEVRRLRERHKD